MIDVGDIIMYGYPAIYNPHPVLIVRKRCSAKGIELLGICGTTNPPEDWKKDDLIEKVVSFDRNYYMTYNSL